MNLSSLLAVCALSACVSGCSKESNKPAEKSQPRTALVFEVRGRVQCDSTSGLTPEQSAMKLTSEGIDVIRSGCGAMTETGFAAVCGGESGELVLHEISSANLDTAGRAGFQPVAELKTDVGTQGYAWVSCDTGIPLP